jgi:hypothetical protein
MQRNLTLVRRILLAMETSEFVPGDDLRIRGAGDAVVAFHVYLLQREHLIDALESGGADSKHPWYVPMALMPAGRAWIDAARDDAAWTRFVESVGARAATSTLRDLGSALTQAAEAARVTEN